MYFFKRIKIHCLMLRYKSSKLDFILLNKPKSEDNLPVKLNGQYIWFFLKNTQFEVIIWSFCYWKKEKYLVKSQQSASMNQNGSAAVSNFSFRLNRAVVGSFLGTHCQTKVMFTAARGRHLTKSVHMSSLEAETSLKYGFYK